MIRQYLAPTGYVVSLQNCMNEATIAEIVGWGKVLGCIASNISVGLVEPGHIHRGGLKGGAAHTVYRCGEVTGRITERAQEVLRLVSLADSAKATDNLWGERWSKLVTNSMANGCLGGDRAVRARRWRRTRRYGGSRRGSAARRSASARRSATSSKRSTICRPKSSPRPARAIREALGRYEDRLATQRRGSAEQRPSMGQDMAKGRRTEIEFLNGFVVREGEKVGLPARANERLVEIVKKVERGELKQDPRNITELRLN